MALDNDALSAEEQAQFDAMRDADAQPGSAPTPAATEAPSAAPAADPAEPDRPQQKMVPHAALHEEREQRKEAERRLAEKERLWEDRFNQVLARVPQTPAQPATEAPPIPDMATDPVGHIVETLKHQGASQAQIAQTQQQISAAMQVGAVEQQLRGWAVARENEFKATEPNYEKAVAHLRGVRDGQLQALGMNDAFARNQQIEREALEIAANAYRSQRNPADVFYQMAKATGYAPASADAAGASPAEGNAPTTDAAAAERLRNVAAGQEQARALPRGSAPAPMNAAKLLAMTDAEFAKALESSEGLALMGS